MDVAGMMTIKEAAARWEISERRVNELCRNGRIQGAVKEGNRWQIPLNAGKPLDHRYKGSQAAVHSPSEKKLPLPIGISDYRKASTEYYYVDKTLLLRDFLDERPQVSLFTRPRRFGKTLNMDMLRTFFEKTPEDTSVYFRNKKIWTCGPEYQSYQGQYPVIFVTFKDVKCETWEETYALISKILRNEFERHSELLTSERLSPYEKQYIKDMLTGKAEESDISMAFLNLSRMLDEHYGKAPVIIIDEYDTPIQQGYMRGYYDQVALFMRNLFSGGLKDNRHLSYGFLAGILRVAKESVFSGLNNLKINSILDRRYSEYFGFTPEEVRQMAAYYGVPEKYEELCAWYDGYRFGDTDIFNAGSVISYFCNECIPQAFWQSTGSNDIIQEILTQATPETMEHLEQLMQGKSFVTHVDTNVIYPQIQKEPSSIYSFLLVAGYLKANRCDRSFGGDYMCDVALPNREISFVYSKEILARMESVIPRASSVAVQEAIFLQDVPALQQRLERFLMQTISFHDAANETFYHGLVLGLCAMLDDCYRITSNREAGTGRYDIQMVPLRRELPGILIELKAGKNCSAEQLEKLAQTALEQIEDRSYAIDLKELGVNQILTYGVAFSGKNVHILSV